MQMVLYMFARHSFSVEQIKQFMATALDHAKYMILYALDIYKKSTHNHDRYHYYLVSGINDDNANKKTHIENFLILPQYTTLFNDYPSVYDFVSKTINMAGYKILLYSSNPRSLDDDDQYYTTSSMCDDGHVNWVCLFPNIIDRTTYVDMRCIQRGYINVARWCVANKVYIKAPSRNIKCFKHVNDAILLLLDNNLISPSLFTNDACKELLKRGYIIDNKHSKKIAH
jgi:hypothetical protein